MNKFFVLLGSAGCLVSSALSADLVSLVRNGTTIGSYATFSEGYNAAQAGDTILFLDDWVPESSDSIRIKKAITVDLGGHAVTNSLNFNVFYIESSPVVFQNGEIGSTKQSVFAASGAHKIYTTNLVFKTCGLYSGSQAELHAGYGCVFKSTILSGFYTCKALVYVEDDSVISVHSSLVDNGGAGASRLMVRAGRFAVDPSRYLEGANRVEAEEYATDYGTCYYKVREMTSADEIGAEVRWDTGTNYVEFATNAISYARSGDTVVLRKDCVLPGTGYLTFTTQFTLDLNNYAISNCASQNLFLCNVDGMVVKNGLVGNGGQSAFVPGADCTMYVTNCIITTPCAAFSSSSGATVVFSGCRIASKYVASNYSTCVVRVEVYDCDVYSIAWKDGNSGGSPVLAIDSGRSVVMPSEEYLGDGAVCVPAENVTDYGTLEYVIVSESELPSYDLSSYEARLGRVYYSTYDDAYNAVTNGGTVTICKDITSFTNAVEIRKTMTLDLDGHRFAQSDSGSNFILSQNSSRVTIVGGGTIACSGSWHVCLLPSSGSTFDVYDCSFEGWVFLYGAGVVNMLSTGSVVKTTKAFVSTGGSATVNVSNGVVQCSTIRDQSNHDGTVINVAGGKWAFNPLENTDDCIVADGLLSAYDADESLYEMVYTPTSLSFDLSSTATPKVYSGTATTAECTVDFVCTGEWDGTRKLLADFSSLSGYDSLTFTVGEVPDAYSTTLGLIYSGGKLYAHLRRGTIVIFH